MAVSQIVRINCEDLVTVKKKPIGPGPCPVGEKGPLGPEGMPEPELSPEDLFYGDRRYAANYGPESHRILESTKLKRQQEKLRETVPTTPDPIAQPSHLARERRLRV